MGGLYLKNRSVGDLAEKIISEKETLNENLYTAFQTAAIIAGSPSFRGGYADAFKNYLRDGAMNTLSGMIDLGMEMGEISTLMKMMFLAYESSESGEVAQDELENIKSKLTSKESSFNGMKGKISSLTNRAAQYISPVTPQMELVNNAYTAARDGITDISERLETTDSNVLDNVKQLRERIEEVATQMRNLMNFVYKDNTLIPENIGKITKQDWYQKSTNVGLTLMMSEDPFFYSADKQSRSARQWAAGLTSDIYAYAGYDWMTKEYEILLRDNKLSIEARNAVLDASAYAQLTDAVYGKGAAKLLYEEGKFVIGANEDFFGIGGEYSAGISNLSGKVQFGEHVFAEAAQKLGYVDGSLYLGKNGNFTGVDGKFAAGLLGSTYNYQVTEWLRGKGHTDVGYLKGDVKAGWGDDFKGVHMGGEVGLAHHKSSVMVGPKWLNFELEGEAKFMCADGKVDAYFEDENNWAIGVDASATAAKAEIGGGLNILDYEVKSKGPDGKKVKKTMLGMDASVGIGLDVGFAAYAKSENVWKGDYINVNATSVKLKGAFGLSAEVELTIPTISINWPWKK